MFSEKMTFYLYITVPAFLPLALRKKNVLNKWFQVAMRQLMHTFNILVIAKS